MLTSLTCKRWKYKWIIIKVFQKKYPIAISYKLIETISWAVDEHETT